MNIIEHFENELKYLDPKPDESIIKTVKKMLFIHEKEGHSTLSSNYVLSLFEDLMIIYEINKQDDVFQIMEDIVQECIDNDDKSNSLLSVYIELQNLVRCLKYEKDVIHAAKLFLRVCEFELLSPLTGSDEEFEVCIDGSVRNIRCRNVFRKDNGVCYCLDSITFWIPNDEGFYMPFSVSEIKIDGKKYTSTPPITFPFTPESYDINVEGIYPNGREPGEYANEYTFVDKEAARKVFEKFGIEVD